MTESLLQLSEQERSRGFLNILVNMTILNISYAIDLSWTVSVEH